MNLLRRTMKGLGIAIAVLLSLIAVAVALIDWDVLQQPIEAYVTRVTGRQLTISGDLDVSLVPQPTLTAEGVHLANAEWSNQPHMLQVEKLSIIIDPLELVTGTSRVAEVHLSGARLWLEHASGQRGNWRLPMDKRGAPKRKHQPSHVLPVPIEALALHDARIYYRDHTSGRNLDMALQRFHLERHAEKLVVQGSGAVSEQPLQLSATAHPSEQGTRWRLSDLEMHVGDSDLTGEMVLNPTASPFGLKGMLHSDILDVKQLQTMLPKPSKPQPKGFEIPPLHALQADLQYAIARFILPQITLTDLVAAVTVEAGTLKLSDAGFDLGNSRTKVQATLSDRQDRVQAEGQIVLNAVDLAQVAKHFGAPAEVLGVLDGALKAHLTPLPRERIALKALLAHLRVEQSPLTYTEPARNTRLTLRPRTVTAESGPPRVRIDGEGRYRGKPLQLRLHGDPLMGLAAGRSDYGLQADLHSRSVHLQVASTWGKLSNFGTLSFEGRLQLEDTDDLAPWVPTSLPPLPPARLAGRVQRNDHHWTLKALEADIGKTAFSGSLSVEMKGRPFLAATLDASRIHLEELIQLGQSTPQAPDQPMNRPRPNGSILAPLQAFDAKLGLQADEVISPELETLRNVALEALLDRGQAKLKRLDLDVADGRIQAGGNIDARHLPAHGRLNATLNDIQLSQLWQSFTPIEEHLGSVSGELHVQATEATPQPQGADLLLPFLGRLTVDGTRLHCLDPQAQTELDLAFHTEGLDDGTQQSLITGDGRYRGDPFRLDFRGDPLLDLRDPKAPYWLDLVLEIAKTRAEVEGTIRQLFALKGMDLTLSLKGPDPRRLYPILGVAFPSLPPYELQGHLIYRGQRWQLSNASGTVGDSDLAGSLAIDASGKQPQVIADLHSQHLDFDDLAGLVGAAPGVGPGETAGPRQRREAKEDAQRPFVLPADPFNLQRLQTTEAQVDYRGRQVTAQGLPLDDLVIEYRLQGGEMAFAPLDFGLGGGEVRLRLSLDTSARPVKGTLEGTIKQVPLGSALQDVAIADDSVGIVGGEAKLWMQGDSIAELLGSADGGIMLLMTGGRLDALLVELVGLDAGEALLSWLGDRAAVPIDCAYTDLQSRGGVLQLETFVVDSKDTLFSAKGSIDFQHERLDLTIQPYPKDLGGPAARAPLHIRGSFKEPNVDVGAAQVAARAGAAIALGLVAGPVAALLPLLDPGTGRESTYCSGLVERIQEAQ